MKPLFAIDLTEDKNNVKMIGEEFLVRELVATEQGGVSELKYTEREELNAPESDIECPTNEEDIKRKKKKKDKKKKHSDSEFLQTEEKKLSRREKKAREREEESYDEKTKAQIALRSALSEAYSDVGVPDDAEEVDILTFSYVIKKGTVTPVIPEDGYTHYVNLQMRIYTDKRRLCLADLSSVYAFDLESVKGITKVKKKTDFPFWNKEVPHNDSLYKPFKVKRHIGGIYTTKYHYILTVKQGEEELQLHFAPYDLAVFERLAEVSFWGE